MAKQFRDFESAREFVRKLGLKNRKEWIEYTKSSKKSNNIPNYPNHVYKNNGWISWGDWTGTGYVKNKEYCSFHEAKKFVQKLRLTSWEDWNKYCKSGNKPDDIPTNPAYVFKNKGWAGITEWLGRSELSQWEKIKKFKTYDEAKVHVHSLKLKNANAWNKYCKSGNKPDDIPTNPARSFKNKGWIDWGDFLGTGTVAYKNKKFITFNDARKFAQNLKLQNMAEWKEYCKLGKIPDDIPFAPDQKYDKFGWISWGDFLGTDNTHWKDFRSFNDAREFVRKLGLKNQKEWIEYVKSGHKPDDIPNKPGQHYKNKGWKGLGDFTASGNKASQDIEFRLFQEARKFVQSLGLKGDKEWREYCKSGNKPDDIPSSPERVYKNQGYVDLGDWIGTGTVAKGKKQYRSFKEAREFVQSLGLKSAKEWYDYCKSGEKPDDIPSAPWSVYKEWNIQRRRKL
jgi:hypothetical protein